MGGNHLLVSSHKRVLEHKVATTRPPNVPESREPAPPVPLPLAVNALYMNVILSFLEIWFSSV